MRKGANEVKVPQSLDQLVESVIGAAITVHKAMGPGLLESVYEGALEIELQEMGLSTRRQQEISVQYKGHDLGVGFRIDLLVDGRLILELKSVKEIEDIHKAQLITYLKLAEKETGLLINFNSVLLKDGIHRLYRGARA
jgi:GxxExxY protein